MNYDEWKTTEPEGDYEVCEHGTGMPLGTQQAGEEWNHCEQCECASYWEGAK